MQSLEGEKRMSVTEETRRESYYKTDRSTRQIEVLGAFRKYGKMTANECAKRLGYTCLLYTSTGGTNPVSGVVIWKREISNKSALLFPTNATNNCHINTSFTLRHFGKRLLFLKYEPYLIHRQSKSAVGN